MYRIDAPLAGDPATPLHTLDRRASLGAQVRTVLLARRAQRNAERFAEVNAATTRPAVPTVPASLASSAR